MNARTRLAGLLIPLSTLVLVAALWVGGYSLVSALEDGDVAQTLAAFSSDVRAETVSREQIAARLDRMAKGEQTISSGASKLKFALFAYVLAAVLVSVLQAMLIRWSSRVPDGSNADTR